jgi:hypothetical protein
MKPDESLEAKTYHKVDVRLLPFLFLCYILAYLDRVNVGFAKLQMLKDLSMSDAAFATGAGIFFIGYFFFEVPSNVLLKKFGARMWIARIMIRDDSSQSAFGQNGRAPAALCVQRYCRSDWFDFERGFRFESCVGHRFSVHRHAGRDWIYAIILAFAVRVLGWDGSCGRDWHRQLRWKFGRLFWSQYPDMGEALFIRPFRCLVHYCGDFDDRRFLDLLLRTKVSASQRGLP